MVFNFPFKFKIVADADKGFCKFFKFQKFIQPNAMLTPNIDYTSANIKEMVNPLSVIEWHFNIKEYSFNNHDGHPHLHKHNGLNHISFVDNNFYDTLVHKEISKKLCLFI